MKKQLAALAHRRLELFEKIEAQRMEVAEISQRWQKPLALVDAGVKTVHFIHNHPVLVAGGMAALLTLRRKGIAGLAQEAWRLLRLYPAIFSLVARSPRDEQNTGVDQGNAWNDP